MNTNKNIQSTPLCVRKTYLAGAGISMDAPSYFPSATQIINMAYECLCSNNPMEQDDFPWQTYKRKLQEHNLRFELVMEIILSADSQINILEAIQKYTEPNENHYYLAKLAIQGNYIFTTNFDDLIERAICNLGYSPITICSQSDYISYQEHKQSAIPIFKLHGSYYRYTGYHKKVVSKRTIQAALSTITSGNSRMILPSYKEHLLVRCISQSSELVFIGYSGSDDFDIMPTLQNLNIPSIVWIDHNNYICYKNVIHKYHISDNERSHFLALHKDHSILFETNTKHFLEKEVGKNVSVFMPQKGNDHHFEHYFEKWSAGLPNDARKFLLGKLLLSCGLYEEAEYVYSKISSNFPNYCKTILNRVKCMDSRCLYGEALSIISDYKKLYYIDPSHPDYLPLIAAEAYNRWRINPNDKFIEIYYKEVLAKSNKNSSHFFDALNNYGLYLRDDGRIKEALTLYQKYYTLACRYGDILAQSWARNNQATLLYDLGCFVRSQKMCEDGYLKAKRINDKRQMGVLENLKANFCYIKGDIDNAIYYCNQSIQRDISVGNKLDSSVNELLLGQCYFELEDYKQSYLHYNTAKRLFSKNGDRSFLYELVFYTTMLHIKRQDYAKADSICRDYKPQDNDSIAFLYTQIARKTVDYFFRNNCNSFFQELDQLLTSDYHDISGYANIVYYLYYLGIPDHLIGVQHRKKAQAIFRKVGNTQKYDYLNIKNKNLN